ncbi:hypothetical protein DM02DRAFT_705047 [Periconia macrospinosa]|uniref:Xylanolytic transcriptional activator regulatory domain-containing protein n=1 Tax=Periconia macrospinosa TaxID=97972 RepID=A0A2V1D031_9PLEO|nr:hypothetical protein DM02DRAFT_705047 [Periconia macrospinosa]
MDDRFRQSGLPTPSGGQYQHAYNTSQSQLPTLPALHGSNAQFPSMYAQHSNPQTPITPHTPVSSTSTTGITIPPISSQHPPLRPIQPSPSSYLPMSSSYSQAPLLPTSAAQSNSHQLGPAGGLGMTPHSQLYPHPPVLANQEPDPVLHVVGQQGRRGILPTVPGRPTPAAGKAVTNMNKNAEGKYKCPHYTFSRSDILKRHFQKCSIRRGNPTGASHLQNAQSHLQKNRQPNGAEANSYLSHIGTSMPYSETAYGNTTLGGMQPMTTMTSSDAYHDGIAMNAHQSMSARTSRSNSLIRPGSGLEENRRSMSALELGNNRINFNDFRGTNGLPNHMTHDMNAYGSQQNHSPASATNGTYQNGYENPISHPEMTQSNLPIKGEDSNSTAYGRPTLPNVDGLSNGQDNSVRWNGSSNGEPQDNFLMNSSMASGPHPGKAASDEPSTDTMFNGLYSNATGFSNATSFLDNWVHGPSDPFDSKARSLLAFCWPDPSLHTPESKDTHGFEALKGLLTAENVKHFLGLYKHYHAHWPMIHMSFNPITAYDGLVLSMICIGAVYSDRLGVRAVRWLMDLAQASVFRSSRVYKAVVQGTQGKTQLDVQSWTDIEEIQALVHINALFVWHGNPTQRKQGQDHFWTLSTIARVFGLLNPLAPGNHDVSALHQPGPIQGNEVNLWTWRSWIEQETRTRVMYMIFLMDVALAIYFNAQPQLDAFDIKLPLPADDAAWEARTEEECANALGLRGQAAQGKNDAGSRRPKQLGFAETLQYLYQSEQLPQRATNIYSKFVLIHAIHAQIFKIQRQMLNINGAPGFSTSGTSTPHSGHVTPVEGISSQISHTLQLLRSTMSALESWKRNWDADMQIQYAPNQKRIGFCRDGIHFYYLAKFFLRGSRREDWAAQPDVRCQQVFHLLKQIRAHVASDSTLKGIDLGSVTTVDDKYGIGDLCLDMKLLFTPISANA